MQTKSASVIVLSGGTSRRFGSDKSQALIAGKSLIAIILGSIPSEFKVVIVGEDPKIESSQYQCVLEEPIGGHHGEERRGAPEAQEGERVED